MRSRLPNLNKVILTWGFATLVSVAFLSDPKLIDGIAYFKVSIATFMTVFIAPLLVMRSIPRINLIKSLLLGTFCLILIFNTVTNDNLYRDLFGAPGRSNGLMFMLNFVYFVLFGVFIQRYFKMDHVFNLLSITSFGVSIVSIVLSYLNLGSFSFLASWNLSNPNFQENSNLIAPLISMGFIAEVYLIRKSKNYFRCLLVAPTLIFLLKLGLLQSIISIGLGLIVLLLFEFKPRLGGHWIPISIGIGYVGGLWLTSFPSLKVDLSVNERREIILSIGQLFQNLSFFPKHVDALSDFTKGYGGSQILDDLHNVFLQTIFSFGILLGLLFLYASLKPFWVKSSDTKSRSGYLATYTVFFVSMIVGISSPNYMYFGAVLIGMSLKVSVFFMVASGDFTKLSSKLLIPALIVIMFVPAALQMRDFLIRKEISNITAALQTPSDKTDSEINRLLFLIDSMPDSGYRYLVAQNFFIVNRCKDGNKILKLMTETNPMESRIAKLQLLSKECLLAQSRKNLP